MATIEHIAKVLTTRKELPHGSQVLIACYLGVKKNNVQTALRGMAGTELTKKVLFEAQIILVKGIDKYRERVMRKQNKLTKAQQN